MRAPCQHPPGDSAAVLALYNQGALSFPSGNGAGGATNISTITGSKVPAGNVTSFYTFAMGTIGGAFLAVAIGDFDASLGLRGDMLRVYLAVLTAMAGGGIGLFASRLGDRIADQRDVRRRLHRVIMHIHDLRMRLQVLQQQLEEMYADGQSRTTTKFGTAVSTARDLGRVALEPPDFENVLDTDDDWKYASYARWVFEYAGRTFPFAESSAPIELAIDQHSGISKRLQLNSQIQRLRFAQEHFDMKAKQAS